MNKWIRIAPDTYYCPGITNIGYCHGLVIDTGMDSTRAAQIARDLKKMGLPIRWLLNTHTHPDHCGGNMGLIEEGAILLATEEQTPYLKDLKLSTDLSYGAEFEYTQNRQYGFPQARPSVPAQIISPGPLLLDDVQFTIERHIGHAADQITVLTPDNVLFTADIMLCERMLSHSRFELLYSATAQMTDLKWLQSTACTAYVPGHGEIMTDVQALVQANLDLQYQYIDEVLHFCTSPRTREEIAAHLIVKFSLSDTCHFCATVYASVGAYLMYLVHHNEIFYYCEKGLTLYWKKTPDI